MDLESVWDGRSLLNPVAQPTPVKEWKAKPVNFDWKKWEAKKKRERDRERKKAQRARAFRAGKCTHCLTARVPKGQRLCDECVGAKNERTTRARQRRLLKGLCQVCEATLDTDAKHCTKCLGDARLRTKTRRDERLAAGRCTTCTKGKRAKKANGELSVFCIACLKKRRKRKERG